MRNHSEKTRDMARSVLPSTRRKGARDDISTAKRKNRRKVRRNLHQWSLYDDPLEFEGFADHDYIHGWAEDENIKLAVQSRRNGDKLSIVRWAKRLCETDLAGLSEAEQYGYFKNILPDNLIGRHALGHIKSQVMPVTDAIESGRLEWLVEDEDGLRLETAKERRKRWAEEREWRHRRRVERCKAILSTKGAHARFNNELKVAAHRLHVTRTWLCKAPSHDNCLIVPRLLTGYDDIEPFIEEVHDGWGKDSAIWILDNFTIKGC